MNPINPTTETPAYVLSGNAVKGVMNKAQAKAFKTNSDGTKGDLLGEAVTDADGRYDINISNYTGVVLLEVVATADTTMFDEATGSTIKPAVGFTLRASAASPSGTGVAKTLELQVNPMTEMAVVAASKLAGGLTLANIEKANSDLVGTLGFNPTTDKPTFSNGVPTNKAAVLLEAISHVAKADDLAACASASGQAAKVKCVVEQIASSGLGNAAVATSLENRIAVVAEKYGVDATIKPVITVTATSGTSSPETTALAQTKAFMATLRSNAKALDAADVSLQTEFQAVENDLNNTVAPFTRHTVDITELTMRGAQFWDDMQKPGSYWTPTRGFYAGGFGSAQIGGCTMYSDEGFNFVATSKADAHFVGCGTNSDFIIDNQPPYNRAHSWNVRARIFPAANDTFTVYTVTRDNLLVYANTGWAEPTPRVRVNYGDLTNLSADIPGFGKTVLGSKAILSATRNAAGAITSISLDGEMSPSYRRDANVVTVLGDKLKVKLVGSLSSSSGVNTVALKGSVAQYKTVNAVDQLQSTLELLDGTLLKGNAFDPSIGVGKQIEGSDGSYSAQLNLKYSRGSSAVTGMLSLANFTHDASKTTTYPTKVSFAGSVERNGAKFFDGSVTAEMLSYSAFNASKPTSATNIQSVKGTVQGTVAIKDRPILNVSLVLSKQDKGSVVSELLSGKYSQGASVFTINGTGGTGPSAPVTLESSSGIKLVIDITKTSHPLTKSGYAVGTFNSATNRVTYTDGTFEQY